MEYSYHHSREVVLGMKKLGRRSLDLLLITKPSQTETNKWTKRGAIVGGVWGLVTGILYAWGIFAEGFAGHEFVFPESLKVICLPAYLAHLISTALAGILSLLLFIIWFVGMPTFFGIMIGIGIGLLITVIGKKVLIK